MARGTRLRRAVSSYPRVDAWSKSLGEDDGLILAASRILQMALLFGASVIIARALGPANRGAYALPLALAGVCWAACHLSFDRGLLRLIGRRECSIAEAITASLAFALLVSVVGASSAVAIGLLWPGLIAHARLATLVLAALNVPGIHLTEAAGALLLVVGKRREWAISVTLGCLTQVVLVLVAIAIRPLTVDTALATAAVSNAVSGVALALFLVRAVRPSREFGEVFTRAKRSFQVGVRMHPGSMALATGARFNLLIVGSIVSLRDTGFFSLAASLAEAIYAGVVGLGSARLQRQTQLPENDAVRYTRQSARMLLATSSGFCLFAAISSYPLIVIAFGNEWLPAVGLAIVLVLGRAVIAPEELLRTLLERIASPWYASVASVSSLLVGVVGAFVLTERLGVIGGALASAISYVVYGLALIQLIRIALRSRVHDGDSPPAAADRCGPD